MGDPAATGHTPDRDAETARRWRLVLGRYAQTSLSATCTCTGGACLCTGGTCAGGSACPGAGDAELDQVLGYLFDREYTERGHRLKRDGGGHSLDPSSLTAISWLERTRQLFPRSTFERLQTQAVELYGLTEVLADADTAATLDPSPELGAALLRVRGRLDANLEAGLRIVIARVVDEIVRRVATTFTAAMTGRRDRFRRSVVPVAQNFDWRATIRHNLSHWDPEAQRLLIDRAQFMARTKRRLPWDVVLLVDQSGSMAASVLHSAVCASILAGLPGVNVRLVLFDTSVVDMTHLADDPVGVLMTAQLGGGTDIARALTFCERLVCTPNRTVLALISDFDEGGSVAALLATVSRLREAGVTLLGIAALDDEANPAHDPHVGQLLADRGMPIAAFTPDRFAEWLAGVIG